MEDDVQFGQIRLIGKISLWFSLVAAVGLATIVFLAGSPVDSYLGSVQSLAMTRKNLPVIMFCGGLVLALGTGVTTWLITVYSTFRVAGPLYRFSRNLEAGIHSGKVPRIRVRGTDYLQEECQLLGASATELEQYRCTLDCQAAEVIKHLDGPRSQDDRALELMLKQLKVMQGRARNGT